MRGRLVPAFAMPVMLAALMWAQQNPPVMVLPEPQQPKPAEQPPAQQPPAPQQPPAAQPDPAQPPQTTPARPPATAGTTETGGFRLQNVSLVELVDIIARQLKINYILDPRVKGSVTINTYGEVKPTNLWQLLETILRINGAAIVQVGDLYRIVPLADVPRLPLSPEVSAAGKDLPNDERMVLNLLFLKYATATEVGKLIQPFLGEAGTMTTYEPANLLILLDNARNMKRTMELIGLFDNDAFAGQRVRAFDVQHGRPSDIAEELENVFKAIALTDKAAVKFLPIDRINTIVAVAPNPGVFGEVEKWLSKFDIPVKVTAGSTENYVYRLKYGRAETIGMAIMALYSGNPFMMMGGMSGMSGMYGGGMGGMYGGGMGGMYGGMGGMYGGGMGGMGGMYGGMGGMGGMYGGYQGYGAFPPNMPFATTPMTGPAGGVGAVPPTSPGVTTPGAATGTSGDLTGSYLGAAGVPGAAGQGRIPRIIPNPFDNTLLIQATPQEWEQISNLLQQLDIPPRQVLIEAKIYEVTLTGAFSSGVAAAFQRAGTGSETVPSPERGAFTRNIFGSTSGGGLNLTAATLVGQSRELLAFLTAAEDNRRTKVIAAPSVIATDSIPAVMNVGVEVPTLSSQAIAPGVQQGGNSVFTNTVNNRNTGVTLNILARVNSSGIVTMVVNQEVSSPQAPSADAAIQSPSFSKRNVQTQVTVQDGDTIAVGGIIQEDETYSSSGVPLLHRIPIVGNAFGAKSISKGRTEMVIFMTPRVIYDTNQMTEASEEMKSRLKKLRRIVKE